MIPMPFIIYSTLSLIFITSMWTKMLLIMSPNHAISPIYQKTLKNQKKNTDMCKVCLSKHQLKSQESSLESIIAYQTSQNNQVSVDNAQRSLVKACNKLRTVEGHVLIKGHQNNQFELDSNITDYKSCVVISDFKENVTLCQRTVETLHDFFHHPKILGAWIRSNLSS